MTAANTGTEQNSSSNLDDQTKSTILSITGNVASAIISSGIMLGGPLALKIAVQAHAAMASALTGVGGSQGEYERAIFATGVGFGAGLAAAAGTGSSMSRTCGAEPVTTR
ncbi:MAG: hypothetical protein KIT81_16470 [Alphaproteobacteria bacterium]|nr:hypothetical protein [Alphaproteobacteria bacterium]